MAYRITELIVYPIKSLGGVSLQRTQVENRGLPLDRRWMLIDTEGNFMSQRKKPKMALFHVQLKEKSLSVSAPNQTSTIDIPYDTHSPRTLPVQIWDDQVEAYEVHPDISTWFSEQMAEPCTLVYMPDSIKRHVDKKYALTADDVTSFADGYPILIIGQASLDDLNSRLATPILMNRFRPNIVFSGGQAYEEEQWKHFRVGEVQLEGVKPCARCVMTTIEQETGNIPNQDPLRTLATYRNYNKKILFGQNVIPTHTGIISVGDCIDIDK